LAIANVRSAEVPVGISAAALGDRRFRPVARARLAIAWA